MMRKRRFRSRSVFNSKLLKGSLDEEPFAGMTNLFDLGVVFALGFMLALISYYSLSELDTKDSQEYTMIKNPGKPDMEVVIKKGKKLEKYRATKKNLSGQGVKLGTAYQLANGEVVYVPESESIKLEEKKQTK